MVGVVKGVVVIGGMGSIIRSQTETVVEVIGVSLSLSFGMDSHEEGKESDLKQNDAKSQ